MISSQGRKAAQPVSNTLAQHPLVLLDQQLKRLTKEDDDAIQRQPRARH